MNETTNDPIRCDRALNALEEIIDPEIGLNIVDLGLIYELDFDDANSILKVVMTLTTPHCPMGESITGSVKTVLKNHFPEMEIFLELTFFPPWNLEKISDEGREFINQ